LNRQCRGDRLPAPLSNRVHREKRTAGLGRATAGRRAGTRPVRLRIVRPPKVWPRRHERA
jgi:hypothetical protein